MSVNIRVIAYTVPAIAMVLGFILLFTGFSTENGEMIRAGWMLIVMGFLLQIFWLLTKIRR